MRGEDTRDFMQPHYILLCVRAYVEEVPANAIVPFFMVPGCIPDAPERFSKADGISAICSANDRPRERMNE